MQNYVVKNEANVKFLLFECVSGPGGVRRPGIQDGNDSYRATAR